MPPRSSTPRRVNGKADDFTPSRLFIYYQQRKTEQNLDLDAGGQLRDGIASISSVGVPPETDWPYDNVAGDQTTHIFPPGAQATKVPTASVLEDAAKYKTIAYAPLAQDVAVLESCIAGGYPFMFGFNVYGEFTEATKILHKPKPDELVIQWGHAALVIGYTQSTKLFRVRNSWGRNAHNAGNFEMDYDYVLNSSWATNFWAVY